MPAAQLIGVCPVHSRVQRSHCIEWRAQIIAAAQNILPAVHSVPYSLLQVQGGLLDVTPVAGCQCSHRHAALLPPPAALAGLDTFGYRPVTVCVTLRWLLHKLRQMHRKTDDGCTVQQTSFLQRLLDDLAQALARNERLLVVAASTFIMSTSHTALRPVMPLFVKAGPHCPCLPHPQPYSCFPSCSGSREQC